MKDKKIFAENILQNLNAKVSSNSYITIPTNHPKIDEILKLLNSKSSRNIENKNNYDKPKYDSKISNNVLLDKVNSTDFELIKRVITLNDLLKEKPTSITISKNIILTPMAKDYIKERKIKINYI